MTNKKYKSNDNYKSKGSSKRRFPAGMTRKKGNSKNNCNCKNKGNCNCNHNDNSDNSNANSDDRRGSDS